MPALETVPASALFTSDGAGRKEGLNAEYFSTSNFNGKAYRPRELTYPHSGVMVGEIPAGPKPLFTRIDPTVDFNWRDAAPRSDMNDDNFGVRWSGFLLPPVSGNYQLGAFGLNAFEVYLDGKLLAEYNDIHLPSYVYGSVDLEAGKMYPIRVEFHETINDASIRLVWRPPGGNEGQRAVEAAKQADAVVMVLGLSGRLEGEEMRVPVEGFQGGDRVQIGLPRAQEDLLRRIVALNKPVVLVLMNGSALAVGWARENVPAIVEAWYPGQAGGTALADVLFGDYNPAGRLPVTFYQSEKQLPPFENYSMKGRTYRYFSGEPLYPFGYGLSYTQFSYRNLALPSEVQPDKDVKVSVEVENSGKLAGEEVVQLYLKRLGSSVPVPIRSLEGFQRIGLQPGERKTVAFTLTPRQLSIIGKDNVRRAEPGVLEVSVGGKQPGFRGAADATTTGVLTGRLRIIGD
jgi:beta-glucosidase